MFVVSYDLYMYRRVSDNPLKLQNIVRTSYHQQFYKTHNEILILYLDVAVICNNTYVFSSLNSSGVLKSNYM